MAPVGTRHIIWHGGEHDFCLAAVGELFALEEKCGPIGALHHRLIAGTWGVSDVREPIRLGLIGGGLSPEKAMGLVKSSVDANQHGLAPSAILALAIVDAVIVGVPDDPVGKPPAPEAATRASVSSTTTAASDAQPSTEPAQR